MRRVERPRAVPVLPQRRAVGVAQAPVGVVGRRCPGPTGCDPERCEPQAGTAPEAAELARRARRGRRGSGRWATTRRRCVCQPSSICTRSRHGRIARSARATSRVREHVVGADEEPVVVPALPAVRGAGPTSGVHASSAPRSSARSSTSSSASMPAATAIGSAPQASRPRRRGARAAAARPTVIAPRARHASSGAGPRRSRRAGSGRHRDARAEPSRLSACDRERSTSAPSHERRVPERRARLAAAHAAVGPRVVPVDEPAVVVEVGGARRAASPGRRSWRRAR